METEAIERCRQAAQTRRRESGNRVLEPGHALVVAVFLQDLEALLEAYDRLKKP